MIIKTVALGLSGGVDSAVSAYLLKRKGFKVSAFFMKNWDETDEKGFCDSDKEFEDALMISERLQIPLKQINYVKEYWNEVFR
jgi:tRNA U34 2-thiouridine synthase MnmA/TrmU